MSSGTEGKALWEILVPAYWDASQRSPYLSNDGVIPRTHHEVWDEQVRAISGGMTIFKSGIGEWEASRERMIPVRFMATRDEALKLANFTKEHYKQFAVMVYKLSDEVFII